MTTPKSPEAAARAVRAPCCGPVNVGSSDGGPAAKVPEAAPVGAIVPNGVIEVVRERYGAAAKAAMNGAKASCCGAKAPADASGLSFTDPITRDLYAEHETAGLPIEALTASFGCGNPTALADAVSCSWYQIQAQQIYVPRNATAQPEGSAFLPAWMSCSTELLRDLRGNCPTTLACQVGQALLHLWGQHAGDILPSPVVAAGSAGSGGVHACLGAQ